MAVTSRTRSGGLIEPISTVPAVTPAADRAAPLEHTTHPTLSEPGRSTVLSVCAPARLGRRTKVLVKHLTRGEIAVIDHLDIDRVSGEDLIAADVAAVLNCSSSSSGTYPNLGPQLLVEAGVLLVDLPDDSLFQLLSDGEELTVIAGGPSGVQVLRNGEVLAHGELLDRVTVRAQTEARRREIGEALERFAHNTIEHMREERELLAGKIEMPRFQTDFRDRPALVVVRGVDHQRDLRALRTFIRDEKPVIVAVDGAADAVLDGGFRPDMIVGDMDSASETALHSGAELVVHSYPNGEAPGRHRVELLGVPFKLVPAPGTSQDIAMLIAAEKGAQLIVSVGSQFNLVEFLDRNRKGMSSTFLTRLRIGETLVDAKGVSRLYRPQPGLTPLLLVLVAGLLAMIAVIWMTPALRDVVDLLWLRLQLLLGSGG
ncbi:MAG TPA: putative cytokinetic ring protein SteA [Solirubrobacteraceae bacterium]